MENTKVNIDEIYVPVKRRKTLNPETVAELAESIMEEGQQSPILVRRDKKRGFILVEGMHRLEACRSLGEETIISLIVQARLR